MKITGIELIPVEIPYKRPFVITGGAMDTKECVILRIETDEGIEGIGEGTGIPEYSGETVEGIYHTLNKYLKPAIIGENPLNIEKITLNLKKAIYKNRYAKAAIDMALYDLVGKIFNTPVYNLLGGMVHEKVPLGWSIGMKDEDEMVKEVQKFQKKGFQSIKVKIGIDIKNDVENVRLVREAIGPDIYMTVDGNQGYSFDKAVKVLKKMEKYDLNYIEQPLPLWNLEGMARLTRELDTPILADESLTTLEDAYNLVRHEACDIFNIKIIKPGGLNPSKKIAAVGEASGIPCLVGSNIEMGIGTAASAHFAASTPNILYPSEIVGAALLKDDIIKETMYTEEKLQGFIELTDSPGLGVTLDEKKLVRYGKDI